MMLRKVVDIYQNIREKESNKKNRRFCIDKQIKGVVKEMVEMFVQNGDFKEICVINGNKSNKLLSIIKDIYCRHMSERFSYQIDYSIDDGKFIKKLVSYSGLTTYELENLTYFQMIQVLSNLHIPICLIVYGNGVVSYEVTRNHVPKYFIVCDVENGEYQLIEFLNEIKKAQFALFCLKHLIYINEKTQAKMFIKISEENKSFMKFINDTVFEMDNYFIGNSGNKRVTTKSFWNSYEEFKKKPN